MACRFSTQSVLASPSGLSVLFMQPSKVKRTSRPPDCCKIGVFELGCSGKVKSVDNVANFSPALPLAMAPSSDWSSGSCCRAGPTTSLRTRPRNVNVMQML